MPLVHRRTVPLLPPPDVDALPKDTEVFYLKETSEIFLDYEAYTARLTYLQSNIFQCEYSGKSGLTYFQAVESEKAESRIVRERFPDELKGRVLFNVQFQVLGRLDGLVDLIYERYKDRYFAGEKVFVDLSGDKYFARIAKAFPPASIRALATDDNKPSTSAGSTSSPAPTAVDDYSKVCHKIGVDMNIDVETAKKDDDPEEYLYTVQLMDEEHKFEGSFMEVKAKALSRDRLAFSKSILKRYIRECVHRDAAIGSPWIVKHDIAVAFGIPTSQTDDIVEKNKQAKEAKLAKRRKGKDDQDPSPATSKKKKVEGEAGSSAAGGGGAKKAAPAPKAIKYPIEDLDLDPMSIHDGRILRRVNAEPPSLPPKPIPHKEILVPVELFESFISTWNLINIFSKPLNISNFTLDEFSSALRHPFLDPKCILLAELHAALINIIASDTSRVFGSTGAAPLPAALKGETASVGGGAEEEEKDEIMEDGEGEEKLKGEAEDEEMEEEFDEELDALVRRGIAYSKRWDRMAKLKSADGRAGWEKHVIGALCQRGGPLVMPNLTRILGHLFEGYDQPAPTSIDPTTLVQDPLAEAALPPIPIALPPGFIPEGDAALGAANPELAYLTLDIEDKVDILGYLCALAMGSKAVRGFMDESETQLTEFRKQRADVNKERKALLEQRALLEVQVDGPNLNGAEAPKLPSPKPPPATSPSLNGASTPAPANGNSNGHSTRAPDSDMLVDEDDEEDQLADDEDLATSSVGLVTPQLGGRSSRASSITSFSGEAVGGGAKSARQIAADEKKVADQAKAVGAAKAREVAKAKNAGRREADKQRVELDEQIKANGKKDDWVEREFRRWQGVSRCRPLGKDRFFCRYWWFDGVGGMDLVGQGGSGILYGTGRLFVQGPTQEDWDAVCGREKEGEVDATERRVREEGGDEERLLGVDEWGFYEEEQELDNLQNWLNAKGTRELSLKNALAKWRGYILAGARKRLAESSGLIQRAPDARRSTRAKAEPELYKDQYLNWTNALAKY